MMEKLGITYPESHIHLKVLSDKIDEIVDWINKHEENPPYVRPPIIG